MPAKLSQPQSTNNPKIFKDFFACKIVLAANHQQPENNRRLSCLQNCLSRKSPKSRNFSKTFRPAAATSINDQLQQPAASTSSSNQQQQPPAATSSSNQQQQSAAAISSSNEQQQSAAATSNSNQQQRPAAATSFSNQHSSYQQHIHKQRRPPLVTTTVPSEGYIPIAVDLGLAAR